MLHVFCRQNRTKNPGGFQHFFIYCLHDGSRLDSKVAVARHMRDHREENRLAMFCGECGEIYRTRKSLWRHLLTKKFHKRRSRIVGYDKHSFNPCANVPPLPKKKPPATRFDVATTSLRSISPTSGTRLTSSASLSTGECVVSGDGDLVTDRCSLPWTTSLSTSGDVTAPLVSSDQEVQDVSVPPVAVTELAGSHTR